jgi:broad specificity phosphatase PhoE
MLILVLTRHGLTDRSHPEQHLGQRIDVPLNDAGRRQATALHDRLVGIIFERIVSSPLLRARETAAILAGDAPVETDRRLLEMDYGAWEGLTYEALEREHAEERAAWERAPDVLACPGGESGYDVAERVGAFLVELLNDHVTRHGSHARDEAAVLAVGHSSTNRILACVALGLPIREYRQRLVQGQANLTVLRFEHGEGPSDARLLLLNDLAHLRPPGTSPWE